MDDVSGLLLLHIGLAPYCLLLLHFPYTAGCFRNHCSGSSSSVSPYSYHPFLSHQPSACCPLLYPQIFSVIFFLPSCLVTPYLTCISAPLHMSEPSWPSISTFVWDFPLKCTFLVLSILVTPSKNLNIFSSTSISLLVPNQTRSYHCFVNLFHLLPTLAADNNVVNIIVHVNSCLTSSSITTGNKKGFSTNPWCNPTPMLLFWNFSIYPIKGMTCTDTGPSIKLERRSPQGRTPAGGLECHWGNGMERFYVRSAGDTGGSRHKGQAAEGHAEVEADAWDMFSALAFVSETKA